MFLKTLDQAFPKLIYGLALRSMHDNGGAAGVDRVADIVGGLRADLTDAASFIKNADGTWTPVNVISATAITGTMPTVTAEKVYVLLISYGDVATAAANPNLLLGSTAGINFVTGLGCLRSATSALYSLTARIASDNEIGARLIAFKNTGTATKKAYHKGWVNGASALTFDDSFGNGITEGTRTTAISGTVDSASFTIGTSAYSHFCFYILELDNMPSVVDMDACVEFMSSSKGEIWPGVAAWA